MTLRLPQHEFYLLDNEGVRRDLPWTIDHLNLAVEQAERQAKIEQRTMTVYSITRCAEVKP